MSKYLYSARFSTLEELTKFVNGKVDIEVQQICHSQHDGWVVFYWTW
jgi:hypothetical protein